MPIVGRLAGYSRLNREAALIGRHLQAAAIGPPSCGSEGSRIPGLRDGVACGIRGPSYCAGLA